MPQSTLHASRLAAVLSVLATAGQAQDEPRLVLQITVDQLRGDMIDRFGAGLGEDGFRYLLANGVHFANAHHRHANTETIVGHTTLATGTDPAVHGMVANLWYDPASGSPVYAVQDPEFDLIGAGGVAADTEIDPTQAAATTSGRSPRNILTTTISDQIAIHFGPTSKIFGVSVKDRGAIAMAGHSGQAYWFSKSDGLFATSTFYRDNYPDWVTAWNEAGKVWSYADTAWELLNAVETYQFGDHDDQWWETRMPGFDRVFPHAFGAADSPYYTTFLTLSPAGDELTVDFAKALIDAEAVGQDDVTDYLSVSLSSTDYVGHIFGPSSLEAEDNLRHLDQTLADLLAHVDARVGLDQTLIVLSADHGAPEHPAYLAQYGVRGGTFDFDRVDTKPGFVRLTQNFGVGAELIDSYSHPYLYLDRDEIAARELDLREVADAVARELDALPGIAEAVSSFDLRDGSFSEAGVGAQVLANFHPDRSGDIYMVMDPHWFIADFDGLTVASTHGSPWAYDSHVPVIISGPGIQAARVVRRVETVDVATTIAAYLGTGFPSGARGAVLVEAVP